MTGPDVFRGPAPMTVLGVDSDLLRGLPRGDPALLASVVRGLVVNANVLRVVHGLLPAESRRFEAEVRPIADALRRVLELDPRPLAARRPLERRLIGVCRHSAALLTALLRAQGVPARSRCGFARYLEAGRWIEHWVTEWWEPAAGRWVRVDPERDEAWSARVGIDLADLPPGAFLSAGEAWLHSRRTGVDPGRFGTGELVLNGPGFIRDNVVRDLAALNGVEMLPWDRWGVMGEHEAVAAEAGDAVFDWLAGVCGRADWPELSAAYADPRFRVPACVESGPGRTAVRLDARLVRSLDECAARRGDGAPGLP